MCRNKKIKKLFDLLEINFENTNKREKLKYNSCTSAGPLQPI